MSRFVKEVLERIELGDGDWVQARMRLPWGDRRVVSEKLLAATVDAKGVLGPSTELHISDANRELLVRAVVAWGGPGFCTLVDHPTEDLAAARRALREAEAVAAGVPAEQKDAADADVVLKKQWVAVMEDALKASIATHQGNCVPAPITAEAIDGLDETAERICRELERRMVRRTPDFTQPPSLPTDTAAPAGPPSSDSTISKS